MKFLPFSLLSLLLVMGCNNQNTISMNNNFSPYPRVREAYTEKINTVEKLLSKQGLDTATVHLFMRAFKYEKELEVWGKKATDEQYQLITTYEICKNSGDLGPKRKEGDYQVPEGFYHIDRFNPKSSYHLSLGINYPNASDKILSDKTQPGSDIFIHGKCVTVGCLPMTDDKMKEIYLLAEFAKRSGQANIPVHIFPFRLTKENYSRFLQQVKNYDMRGYGSMWYNLKGGYDYFETKKQIPTIKVDDTGKYLW